MAQERTTNLDLVLPLQADDVLVQDVNGNMTKIDTFAGQTNQALSNVNSDITNISGRIIKIKAESVTTSAYGNATTSLNPQNCTLISATDRLNYNNVCSIYLANGNTYGVHIESNSGQVLASATTTVRLVYTEAVN